MVLVVVVVVAAVACGRPAIAQTHQPTASDIALAREQFRQGMAAMGQQDWASARDAFDRSYQLYPRPATLLNLAGAQMQLGQIVEAEETYRRFLHVTESGEDAEGRGVAQQQLEALEPRLPHVRLAVDGLAEGDTIEVDGHPLSASVLGVDLPIDPGAHTLRVLRHSNAVGEARFSVEERGTASATLHLPTVTASAAPSAAPIDAHRVLGPSVPPAQESHGFVGSGAFWGIVIGVVVVGAAVAVGAVYLESGSPAPYMGNVPPGSYTVP